jgi:hypothetical protein
MALAKVHRPALFDAQVEQTFLSLGAETFGPSGKLNHLLLK